ncbi:hypothetical protein CDL12_13875 [Handroanthus impetiginosus]|uniref:PUB domain-containing protein n=1 Tax=Handroanthus impetiginosus TaxID=429701 RepID=A0A2G9H7L0_9LAMI|nr:hypothetical protein CDL12_13875 [Handroanthus impetiginosus]
MGRIRVGRELLEAEHIEEENERKRFCHYSRIFPLRLEFAFIAERCRKLGLPPKDPVAAKPSAPPVEEKKVPATKAEQMRECLTTLKQNHKDDDAKVKTAFDTLPTFAKNVATNPNDGKFRKIRLTNANFQVQFNKLFYLLIFCMGNISQQAVKSVVSSSYVVLFVIQDQVGKMKGGIEFLELCEFKKIEGNEFLYLPRESF